MKTTEIKKLIEAFYQGETTVEEEKQLFQFFQNENIPVEFHEEKKLFLQLYTPEPINIPENLEIKLSSLIDELDKKENIIPLQPKKNIWLWIGSAACVAVLVVSLIIRNNHYDNNSVYVIKDNQPNGIITDPEIAARETQKALTLVSKNFNKGTDQLALLSINLKLTNQIIEKQFKSINIHRNNQKQNNNNDINIDSI